MMVGGHHIAPPDIALVPPSFSDFSTTSTRRPPTAATRAQTNPAAPGPTTTTSISFGIPGSRTGGPDDDDQARSRDARQHLVADQFDRAHDLLVLHVTAWNMKII